MRHDGQINLPDAVFQQVRAEYYLSYVEAVSSPAVYQHVVYIVFSDHLPAVIHNKVHAVSLSHIDKRQVAFLETI